jgi:predicted transposase/invertase (TIGR01784 family)
VAHPFAYGSFFTWRNTEPFYRPVRPAVQYYRITAAFLIKKSVVYYKKEYKVAIVVQFEDTDDLIDICLDNVFKAVFTRRTPESQGALSKLVSAVIGRELLVDSIRANEPPVDNIQDKQIRFDISCKTGDGELVNVEMFLNSDVLEPVRLEFYAGKLFTGQDIRGGGKSYSDLKAAYQISFLVKKRLFEDDEFFHIFEYYDAERKVSLGGRSRIIILELSKVERVIQKPAKAMTTKERWAAYFRYMKDKSKREKINEIIKCEEGIAMASEVLVSISKDEVERARLLSEYKYEMDRQSSLVDAKREGKREVAQKMKGQGISVHQIAEFTDLSPDDIAKL